MPRWKRKGELRVQTTFLIDEIDKEIEKRENEVESLKTERKQLQRKLDELD
jgi:hypothetical protein